MIGKKNRKSKKENYCLDRVDGEGRNGKKPKTRKRTASVDSRWFTLKQAIHIYGVWLNQS